MDKHLFHIPVMGIGYTLDTPIRVAKYGVSSAISLVQDNVIEKARKLYSSKYGFEFSPINRNESNYRSKRITAYLNLVNNIVNLEFENVKSNPSEVRKFFSLLPSSSDLTEQEMMSEIQFMEPGAIDVNIMTKLDRMGTNGEYGLFEACSALKGFAKSDLKSSIILSAGLNPRLFSYMEQFEDFYPNAFGKPTKKVSLKVSDFRSALVQGKTLAKKGIWVSEFRIESGLNCGGHAFATQGNLLGPILEEFKSNRKSITEELAEMCNRRLKEKNKPILKEPGFLLTVQGGLGTSEEREYLHKHYQVDGTGWGSPFLLVPEATSIDEQTLHELIQAGEEDIYVSNVSPLGVKFNTIRNNSADRIRQRRIESGKPGSPCHRKHLALKEEENGKSMCPASRQYQIQKIDELEEQKLSANEYRKQFKKITDKECLCSGLALSFLKKFSIADKTDGVTFSVCPGPNLAYFNRTYSLKEMVDHIYGRINLVNVPRPNFFLKELTLYVEHLQREIAEIEIPVSKKAERYLETFRKNLLSGIEYYKALKNYISSEMDKYQEEFEKELIRLESVIKQSSPVAITATK